MSILINAFKSKLRDNHVLLGLLFVLLTGNVSAQVPGDAGTEKLAGESFSAVDKKYSSLNERMNKYLEKELRKEQKFESKLAKKLSQKDSLAASNIFEGMGSKYEKLNRSIKNPLENKRIAKYIPFLDSLQTTGKFLEQSNALSKDKLVEVQQLNGKLKELEGNFTSSEQVEKFLKERKELLTAQLERFGMSKELTQLKKQVYYYHQQIEEYKNILNDEKKMETKALEAVRKLPAFQSFMQKNSYLSQLFPSPTTVTTNNSTGGQTIPGLQTRESVQSILQERLGVSNLPSIDAVGGTAADPLQESMQAAQQQMNALKDKINKLGGSSSDMEMPDFKPNTQKTKTLFERLEPNLIMQSSGSSKWLPALMDLGVSLGYKLNDKSTVGIKAAYKIGFGQPIKNIRISSEGLNMGAFLDIKIKGSWWASGGAEYNYLQSFKSLQELHSNVDVWQQSALLGISKKIKAGKRSSNIQLLYDFLWNQQLPVSQPLKFRVGVGL